jgi:gamma-glutamyltranspeptidase/glutathione hydrolase
VHSCNCLLWGATGIFVDGVSIPDSASFQQDPLARARPGVRLPESTNPVIVLKNGRPALASSAIGAALHETTFQNLINVLDFGMDPHAAVEQPNFTGPFLKMSTRLPFKPEMDKETFRPGDFSEEVLAGVSARGQAIKMDSGQPGYWIGVQIASSNPRKLVGGVTSRLPALVEGY